MFRLPLLIPLVGRPIHMSPELASQLVEDLIVEHETAARYQAVGQEAGPFRANENDIWLARHGEEFRNQTRDRLRKDKDEIAVRGALLATGVFSITWVATHEINRRAGLCS